jgi:hypothetical protein
MGRRRRRRRRRRMTLGMDDFGGESYWRWRHDVMPGSGLDRAILG